MQACHQRSVQEREGGARPHSRLSGRSFQARRFDAYTNPYWPTGGKAFTTFSVSRLTVMTWAMRRTMYCGSSGRLGALVMPLRLPVLTWYWRMVDSLHPRPYA